MSCFRRAELLIPAVPEMEKWPVVACDQFTSQPDYWQRVEQTVGSAPSALRLILPEAWLNEQTETEDIAAVNETMEQYLTEGVFDCLPESYLYVERTLPGGQIRRGVVGMIDLEAYDWRPGAQTPIRATEGTVPERLPPRIRVREGAALELPHVLLLADDPSDALLYPLEAACRGETPVYDLPLMEGGGQLRGWRIAGAAADALDARLAEYEAAAPLPYAVGDGNHSLAAARAIWEERRGQVPPDHPARFALVELENIHDPALAFAPIHRLVTGVDPQALLAALEPWCAPGGYPVRWYAGDEHGTVMLDPARAALAVGVLQAFLDAWGQGTVDYIHGDEAARSLAKQPGAIAFLLPAMEKSQLFEGVLRDGSLPRKTFSMGQAEEKRYYLEARRIR